MKQTPTEEQETTIIMEALSKTAEIYTCEPNTIRQMEKLAEAHPDEVVIEHPDDYGIIVRLPRKYIKVKAPRQGVYSEERKQQAREQLAKLREARQNQF